MPKLYSARIILAALKRAKFHIISQRGSHIKLSRHTKEKTLTVIVPNHREIARGTFNSILSQSSLTEEEFKSFLR